MLTLTKYAFLILALVLAILALNFGRSKIILTGSQNVSLAFYRYTIQETDITVEYPSNVLARITPTQAEQTLMQNTGLVMQYKIDYTDANLTDIGWTTYNSQNQPAILDDCTISCRYYGTPATSGGVEFTGPETTKQVKMPKIKLLSDNTTGETNTTLILTKEGTASTADSYVKAADYYGEAIDYQGNTSDTKTYRLFYVDFDDKYKDGEGTIYLKADWTANDTELSDHITFNPQDDKDATIIANMNQQWKNAVDANEDGKINSNEITNVNGHAAAWLTSPSQWTEYANGNANKTGSTAYKYTPNGASVDYDVNYAIGGPSVEMYFDSLRESYGSQYKTEFATIGYKYSNNNGDSLADGIAGLDTRKNGMYTYSSQGEVWWWLASPHQGNVNWMCGVSAYGMGLTYYGAGNSRSISPVISIQPTTINSIGNYVELNASNRIVKGYNTLTSALSTVTNENTIKPLNDMTETVAPALAAGKTATLDLNGKIITLNNVTLTNNGPLTITGSGKLISTGDKVCISNKGGLIKNGSSSLESSGQATVDSYGKVTLNDGGIVNSRYSGIVLQSQGQLEMKGGDITATSDGVYNASTYNTEANPSIKVTSGTINSGSNNSGICNRANAGGTVVVQGGTISGGNGVYMKSGTLITGKDDSTSPSITAPIVIGSSVGVKIESGTFNFYDGIIKVPTGNTQISGTVSATPTGYSVKYGTTTENGTTYETAYLDNHYNLRYLSENLLDGVTLVHGIVSGDSYSGPTNGVYTGTLTTNTTSYWKIDENNFTNGKTYVLKYKIQKTAGTLKNIAGHSNAATQRVFTIDGKNSITPYHLTVSTASNITDDTNEHIIEFEFLYNGNQSDNNIYIQPNRYYAGNVTLKLYDVELYEVIQENTKTYGATIGPAPAQNPTRTGYTFNGWKTDDNLISTNVADWENGGIDDYTGINSSNSNVVNKRLRLKDYVKVSSSSSYTLTTTGLVQIRWAYFYDASKNYIGCSSIGYNSLTFNTPANCKYIRVVLQKQDPSEEITLSELTSANLVLSGTVGADMLVPANDIDIKSNWTANNYTVTLDANTGTIPATTGWTIANGSTTATKSVTFDQAYGTLPTPTKTGYVFTGWYNTTEPETIQMNSSSDSNFEHCNVIKSVKPGTTYYVTMDSAVKTSGNCTSFTTLIYDYTQNKSIIRVEKSFSNNRLSYSITCPNDVAETNNLQILIYAGTAGSTAGMSVTLTNVRVGLDESTDSIKYTNSSTVSTAYNHTLHAHWTINQYTITFAPNGGTMNSSTSATSYTQDYGTTITMNNPTKTGYSFMGWVSDKRTNWTTAGYWTYPNSVDPLTGEKLEYIYAPNHRLNGYAGGTPAIASPTTIGGSYAANQSVTSTTSYVNYTSSDPNPLQNINATRFYRLTRTGGSATGYSSGPTMYATYQHKDINITFVIVARIPVGWSLQQTGNSGNADGRWLTSQEGTGEWKTYIITRYSAENSPYQNFGYFYLTKSSDSAVANPTADFAYIQAYYTNKQSDTAGDNVFKIGAVAETLTAKWKAVDQTVSITPNNANGSFKVTASNLFDKNGMIISNTKIVKKASTEWNGGSYTADDSTRFVSQWIPVVPGATYKITGATSSGLIEWSSDGDGNGSTTMAYYQGTQATTYSNNTNFIVPPSFVDSSGNTVYNSYYYMRFHALNSDMNNISLEMVDSPTYTTTQTLKFTNNATVRVIATGNTGYTATVEKSSGLGTLSSSASNGVITAILANIAGAASTTNLTVTWTANN